MITGRALRRLASALVVVPCVALTARAQVPVLRVPYAVGERLGLKGYVGAAVILGSIVVAEAPSWVLTARSSNGETDHPVRTTGEHE